MTNKEKAVGLSLQVRDLCVEKGVTRDNAETVSLLVQQVALQMATWKDSQFKEDIYKFCELCESKLTQGKKYTGCAFRSLGHEYCDFIDNMLKKYKI